MTYAASDEVIPSWIQCTCSRYQWTLWLVEIKIYTVHCHSKSNNVEFFHMNYHTKHDSMKLRVVFHTKKKKKTIAVRPSLVALPLHSWHLAHLAGS